MIRAQLEQTLKDAGAVITGNVDILYTPTGGTLKVNFTLGADAESLQNSLQQAWNEQCARFHLLPSDFGRVIKDNGGRDCRLIAFQPGRSKYPIVAEVVNNPQAPRVLFQVASARRRLGHV
jgi:hypothetical protein